MNRCAHSPGFSLRSSGVLVLALISILMLFLGCSTIPAETPDQEQQEEDDSELDDSVFFHEQDDVFRPQIKEAESKEPKETKEPSSASPVYVQMAAARFSELSFTSPEARLEAYEAPEVPVERVSAGNHFSLLLDVHGNVWSSGKGNYGQTGNGQRSSSEFLPVRMGSDIEAISAGSSHSLLLSGSGDVYAFGDNTYYQLGLENSFDRRFEPEIIAYDMQAIEAGLDHSHLLDSDGNLYRVGNRVDIDLQIPGQSSGPFSQDLSYVLTISSEQQLVAPLVVDVASDFQFTFYIQEDSRAWASGKNTYGQLGIGTTEDMDESQFVLHDVIAVSTGLYHTLLLRSDHTLWSVGRNDQGQLGNGTRTSSSVPMLVMQDVVSMDAGAFHSLAVDSQGTLWGFGGIALDERPPDSEYGITVPFPLLGNVSACSAGYGFSLAVKHDGSLWVLGDNREGELGLPSPELIKEFTKVDIRLPQLESDQIIED